MLRASNVYDVHCFPGDMRRRFVHACYLPKGLLGAAGAGILPGWPALQLAVLSESQPAGEDNIPLFPGGGAYSNENPPLEMLQQPLWMHRQTICQHRTQGKKASWAQDASQHTKHLQQVLC